jgi:hypothetical protein
MFIEKFYSPLVAADLLERLQANTAPESVWSNPLSSKPKKLFRGTIDNHSFAIQRVISYRNSMLPQLEGEVMAHPDVLGSFLMIKYRPTTIIVIFAVAWLGLTGMMTIGELMNGIRLEAFTSQMASTSGLFLAGLAFLIIPFWLEMRKARTVLKKLLSLSASSPT